MPEWLISLISVFWGAILGAFLGWSTSLKIIKKKEFYHASSEFRESFIKELLFLKKPLDTSVSPTVQFLEKAIEKHQIALIRFLPYLKKSERNSIKKAFKNYLDPLNFGASDSEIKTSGFNLYDGYSDSKNKFSREEGRELALKNMKAVLEFSKFK